MAWFTPYLLADGQADYDIPDMMDYVLRPGESLTCHYQPQNRFHHPVPPHYANACLRWYPNLHTDLNEIGVSCTGFDRVSEGLQAAHGNAAVRYCLASPWIISGRYEAFDVNCKRLDGLLLRINASAAPVIGFHTPCNGRCAQVPVQQDSCEYTADLTEWADVHHEYELTINLPAGQLLRGLIVETWCQVAPAAPPGWCEPGRTVRLATGRIPRALEASSPPRPPGESPPHPIDLLLRWRHNGKLRTYQRRFCTAEVGQAFVPIPDAGDIQPLHLVLSVRRGTAPGPGRAACAGERRP